MRHASDSPADQPLRRAFRAATLIGLAIGLSACGGGLRQTFGIDVPPPDAFNVQPHKPLRLPGDLSYLPRPDPGAESPLAYRPVDEAKAALRHVGPSAGAPSAGELALLEAAGADAAQPDIRTVLAGESAPASRKYGLTSIFGYEMPDGRIEEILDQRDETGRLRDAGVATPTPPPVEEEEEDNGLTFELGVFGG
ncbi:DUF3035 domain-containing protein [Rhodovulum sp. DZ06]|uniref:DUF3035 domain-containing protein n=1 Tax=Rhodovulum sp. DZ06 TaxID=3425126 RepID=UPI003D33A56E